jgi:hypothetical protein
MKLYKVLTCKRITSEEPIPGGAFNQMLREALLEGWVLAGKILFSRTHEIISCVLSKE